VDGIFGKTFVLGEQDNQSYKQLGNAVNVNMILEIQKNIDLFISDPRSFPVVESIQETLDISF
jgi:hypothetical protein